MPSVRVRVPRRFVVLLSVLLAMLLVTGALAGCASSKPNTITTSGTIMATEISAAAEVTGKVTAVLVSEGQRVKAGDKIATIDDVLMRAYLKQAEAQLAFSDARLAEARVGPQPEAIRQAAAAAEAAQRQVNAAESQVVQAQRNVDQILDDNDQVLTLSAMGQGLDTKADAAQRKLDSAQAALEASRQQAAASKSQAAAMQAQATLVRKGYTAEQVRQLQAQVSQAEAAVEIAKFNVDRSVITSPIAGTVVRRTAEPGTFVSPGMAIATLIDTDDLWLRVYVPTKQLNYVRLGAKVDVKVDAYPDRTFKAEVVYISDKAEYTPRNTQTSEERSNMVYAVKVKLLEGLTGEVKPGMPADVTFSAHEAGGR